MAKSLAERRVEWQMGERPDEDCPRCHGVGYLQREREQCARCKGSGWLPRPPSTPES